MTADVLFILIDRYSFCFQTYCYLRDLHSFPTRRSSDLSWRILAVKEELKTFYRKVRQEKLAKIAKKDRKSTRLNSSHEWISYAVFCLKKKRQKNEIIFRYIQNSRKLSAHNRVHRCLATD